MKLKDILLFEGEIELLTGLHIGAGNDEIKIGGTDNPVIRNSFSGEPYIPGSSLKGKMRSLLELYLGRISSEGGPWQDWRDEEGKLICKLFGISGAEADEIEEGIVPARLSFYDLSLKNVDELKEKVGALLTEDKAEVFVNRISGTGKNPRHTERVPAGAVFEFKLLMKLFEGDSEDELIEAVEKGLRLIELDSLGGNGSRGYGKVKFKNLVIKSQFTGETKKTIETLDSVKL